MLQPAFEKSDTTIRKTLPPLSFLAPFCWKYKVRAHKVNERDNDTMVAKASSSKQQQQQHSTPTRFVPPSSRPISTEMLIHNDHSKKGDTSSNDSDSEGQSVARGGVVTPFPWKVHDMLEKSEIDAIEHIVCWVPHGRAFMVHLPQEFVEQVMVRFLFPKPHWPLYYFRVSQHIFSLLHYSPFGFHKLNSPHSNGNWTCMAFAVSRRAVTRGHTFTPTFWEESALEFNEWVVKKSRVPKFVERSFQGWNLIFGRCRLCRQEIIISRQCRLKSRRQHPVMLWAAVERIVVLQHRHCPWRIKMREVAQTFSFSLKESLFITSIELVWARVFHIKSLRLLNGWRWLLHKAAT